MFGLNLPMPKLLKLGKYGGLKDGEVTPAIIREVADALSFPVDDAVVNDVSALIQLGDEETLGDWLGSSDNMERLKALLVPQEEGPQVILCPHCQSAIDLSADD